MLDLQAQPEAKALLETPAQPARILPLPDQPDLQVLLVQREIMVLQVQPAQLELLASKVFKVSKV
jgi:hypothetical protein